MTTELLACESQCSGRAGAETAADQGKRAAPTYTPRVDIVETPDEVTLYLDLPGVSPERIDVRFDQGELTIRGQAAQRHVGRFLCREYGVGDFQRTFVIDDLVDSQQMSAELKHGVLTVHLPKSPAAKPQRIAVKAV